MKEVYGQLDDVRIVTLAPEIAGAKDAIPTLVRQGITVSLGKIKVVWLYNFKLHNLKSS